MSSDDSNGTDAKNILSGLPDPNSGSVSPLHGGPRPQAAAKNPFASSDQIEVQRPAESEGSTTEETPPTEDSEAAVEAVTETEEATSTPQTDAPASKSNASPSPTSAFRDEPTPEKSNTGVVIAVVVAAAVAAFFALR